MKSTKTPIIYPVINLLLQNGTHKNIDFHTWKENMYKLIKKHTRQGIKA